MIMGMSMLVVLFLLLLIHRTSPFTWRCSLLSLPSKTRVDAYAVDAGMKRGTEKIDYDRYNLLSDREKMRKIGNLMHESVKRRAPLTFTQLDALAVIINNTTSPINMIDASKILRGLKLYTDNSDPGLLRLLNTVIMKLAEVTHNSYNSSSIEADPSGGRFDARAISNSLSGLANFHSDTMEIRVLLSLLTANIHGMTDTFNGQGVAMSFFGLKKMSSETPEVRGFLKAFVYKIKKDSSKHEKLTLTAQGVGNACYGLQSMSSEYQEVREALQTLKELVNTCSEKLSGQEVCNALYGLKSLNSEHAEVRGLLSALAKHTRRCKCDLSSQEIGMALYGIRNMDTNYIEVREIVNILSQKIEYNCNQKWSGHTISNSLYSLQNKHISCVETLRLMEAISMKVEESDALLNSQGVANSLYGFQSMKGSSKAALQLFEVVTKKINSSLLCCKLSMQEISMSIYGLQGMSDCDGSDALPILEALYEQLKVNVNKGHSVSHQTISNILFGMQKFSCESEAVKGILSLMTSFLREEEGVGMSMSDQEIGMSLYFLRGKMSDAVEVKGFMSVLSDIIESREAMSLKSIIMGLYALQNMRADSRDALRLIRCLTKKLRQNKEMFTSQSIGNALYGLQNFDDESREIKNLLTILTDKIAISKAELSSQEIGMSMNGLKHMNGESIEVLGVLASLDSCVPADDGRTSFLLSNRILNK